MSSARMAIHWPDRHIWAARVFATRAGILDLIDHYPWAAGLVAVPLTIIGLAGVVVYPFLFGPLLVLLGVGLVAIEYYADQQQAVDHQAEAAAGARKWNLRTRISDSNLQDRLNLPQLYTEARARMDAAEAKVRAADARARAAAAQVAAAEAEKQAEAAQDRVAQLRSEATAKTERNPEVD
jgi:colicin import membrane protein